MTSSLLAVAVALIGAQQEHEVVEANFQKFVTTVESLKGKGLPDLRDVKYCSFMPYRSPSVEQMLAAQAQIGWVLPPMASGVQYAAVAGPAGYVEVEKVLDEVTIGAEKQNPGFVSSVWDHSFAWECALWVLAGEIDRASEIYKQRFSYRPAKESGLLQVACTSAIEMSVVAFLDRRFDQALAFLPLIESAKRDDIQLGPFEGLTERLVADIERRKSREVPDLEEVLKWEGQRRYDGLVLLLENHGEIVEDVYAPNRTAYSTIAGEGEAIIPTLIKAFGRDDRLTFARDQGALIYLNNRGGGSMGLTDVSTVAYELVSRLWVGFPYYDRLLQSREEKSAMAMEMLSEWSLVQGLNPAERHFRNVLNPRVEESIALRSLEQLLTPAPIEGGMEYRPGGIPLLLDALSEEQQKQLGKTAEARLLASFGSSSADRRRQPVDSSYVFLLSRLQGGKAIPALRRYTGNVLGRMASHRPESRWSLGGAALADVVAQRIALGDELALVDYMRFASDFKEGSLRVEYLRPGWEFPENKSVQKEIRTILGVHQERQLFLWQKEKRWDTSDLFGSDWKHWGIPAVREWAVKILEMNDVVGEATLQANGQGGSYLVQMENNRHQLRFPAGQETVQHRSGPVPVTSGDFLAARLAERMDTFKFSLLDEVSRIREQKRLLIEFLRQREFDVSLLARNQYVEVRKEIYMPGDDVGLIPKR